MALRTPVTVRSRDDTADLDETKKVHLPASGEVDWVGSVYFSSLAQRMDGAINYLHTTLNWALTVVAAAFAATIAAEELASEVFWAAILVACVAGVHLMVRSGKAYINVARWATLERHILSCFNANERGPAAASRALEAVDLYHRQWCSPISATDVFYKLAFEFGYAYVIGALAGLAGYAASETNLSVLTVGLGVLAGLFAILEVVLFLRSPYLASIRLDADAHRLR